MISTAHVRFPIRSVSYPHPFCAAQLRDESDHSPDVSAAGVLGGVRKKDLAYALEVAANTGVDAEGARHVDQLFDRAIAAWLGDQYFPVVSRIVDADPYNPLTSASRETPL